MLTHLFILLSREGERPSLWNVNKIFYGGERERCLPFLHYPGMQANGASGDKSILSPEQNTVSNFQGTFSFQTLNAMIFFSDSLRVIIKISFQLAK